MKMKDLKNQTTHEWQTQLTATRDRLRELRFKTASGQQKDVRELREAKTLIARLLTLLNSQK